MVWVSGGKQKINCSATKKKVYGRSDKIDKQADPYFLQGSTVIAAESSALNLDSAAAKINSDSA